MKAKLLICMVLAAVLLCLMPTVQAIAQTSRPDPEVASPMYTIAENVSSTLRFDGTTAYCISDATGQHTVSITAEQTLQKQGSPWIRGKADGASRTKTVG